MGRLLDYLASCMATYSKEWRARTRIGREQEEETVESEVTSSRYATAPISTGFHPF
jgi:hypothetical protein